MHTGKIREGPELCPIPRTNIQSHPFSAREKKVQWKRNRFDFSLINSFLCKVIGWRERKTSGVLQHFFIYKWQGQNHHKMTNKPIYVLLKWHFLGTILIFQVFCPHISPDPILIHQLGLKSIFNRVSIKTIYTSIIIIKYLNPTELTIASILIIVVSPVSSPNLQKAQCHSQ